MGADNPADFVREFDERQAAEEAARAAAEKAAAEAADVALVSPDGSVFIRHVGLDAQGNEVTREGTFVYRLAVTAADNLAIQCGMQRFTPVGLNTTEIAQLMAVLNVVIREVPQWIPRGPDGRPDWLNTDATIIYLVVGEVDKHAVRFRERIGARRAAPNPGPKPG